MINNYNETVNKKKLFSFHWSLVTQSFFYMFLLTSPLIAYGMGTGLFNYRFSRLFLILSVITIVIERIKKRKSIFFKLLPFEYLVGIYYLFVFLSLFYVTQYDAFFKKFFGLTECLLILYVIRVFTYEGDYWFKTVQVYLYSSITVLAGSFYQIINSLKGNPGAGMLPFPSLQLLERYTELQNWAYFGSTASGMIRVSSTFIEPNILAGYCASLIPFALVVVIIYSSNKKNISKLLLNLFILIGLAVMVIATVSKSGFLSMGLAILFIFISIFKILNTKQKYWFFIIIMFILASIILYGLRIIDLISYRLSLVDSGHLEYSLNVWDVYKSAWFTGYGFGQYWGSSAHTIILTALYELGLPGGITIIILTLQPLSYIKYLSRLFSKIKHDPKAKSCLLLLAASLASFSAVLLGLYLYDYWIHLFTWISISLLISLVSIIKRDFDNGKSDFL